MNNLIIDMNIEFETQSSESSFDDISENYIEKLIESLTFDKKLGIVTYKNRSVVIADNYILYDPIHSKVFADIFHLINDIDRNLLLN